MNGMAQYVTSKEEMERVPAPGRVMVTVLLEEKDVIQVNFWPRGTTGNSSHHSETLGHLNAYLYQVSTTRNLNSCSSISYRSHTSVHNTEAITEFGWIVLLHLPYSLEFARSDYILFHPWKKKAVKEGEHLFLGRNTYSC
jgi:hypothetical protein